MNETKHKIKEVIRQELEILACEKGLFDMDVIEGIAEKYAVKAIDDLIHSKKLWRKFRRNRDKLFDKIKGYFK